MNSWFGEAWSATVEETDEERFLREQEQAQAPSPTGAYFGQQFSQPEPQLQGPLNPNAGGFRDPVYNPANVTPGDQYAPNPDFGVFTPFHPINEQISPYLQDASAFVSDAARQGFEALSNQQNLASGGYGMQGDVSTAGDVGAFLGSTLVPQSVEEFALNSLGGGGLTGYDDVIRGAVGARGAADDLFRAAMPEPQLFPGLGAGVPPGSMWDESILGPLPSSPDLGQGPQMLGGEVPLQGRIDAPIIPEPSFGARLDELTGAQSGTLPDGSPFTPGPRGYPADLPTERYPSFPEGTMGEQFPDIVGTTQYSRQTPDSPWQTKPVEANSPAARMGAPLAYDPQYIPGTREYNAREAYEATQGAADDTASQMQDAFNEARRQESILTGGGVPATPTQVTPPPASTLTGGGSTPSSPSVPESVAGPVAATPPPASTTEQGIANDPGLSDAQREFLRSPNGQAAAAQRDAAMTGARPDPEVTANAVRDTAKNMGLPEGRASQIAEAMKRSQEATYNVYSSPQGASRVTAGMESIAHRIEGAISGNEPDSFLNALLSERTAMENALARAGVSENRATSTVENHLREMVERHYPDVAKREETFKALATHDARAKTLEKDFKLWTTVNDALKNTVASIGDFAVVGVNGLVEMAQAGPYMALGTLNRAVNGVASLLHHPTLLDYERVTGLPNIIAKESLGLPFKYGGEGFRTGKDAPTIFGVGGKWNPLSPIDKNVIQPAINFNNKLQFDMVQGWAKNSISDGLLTQEYVRKFAEGMVVNRGNIKAANDFAMEYVSRPDVLRDITRFTRNATSSTTKATAPGRNMLEDLLPFSAAYTRAQPARLADMAKLIAPGASETQRVLAASAIFSTAVFTLGLYKFLNDKFGTTEAQTDLSKPGAGRVVLPGGQVISMFPQSTLRNAMVNVNEAIKDKRPEDIKGIMAQTAISRLSPLFSSAIRGTGYGYDTKGNFYSPFKNDGATMPTSERLKGSIPLPFTAQGPLFNGQPVFSLETGLDVAGLNSYNERASTTAYRERNEAAQIRSQALVNGDLLRAAFPENPDLAAALQGASWASLEREERNAILAALPPESRKQIEEADAVSAKANKESPTAIGNAIEIRNKTDEAIIKLDESIAEKAKPLQDALFSGTADPKVVATAVKDLKDLRTEELVKELWKGGTTYTGLKWPDGSDKKAIESPIEKARAEYQNLGSLVPRLPDGKFDYDFLTHLQVTYLNDLKKEDPTTAARLGFINKEKAREAEERKPDIVKLYDFVSNITQDYWNQAPGTKATYLRDHPDIDAWLNLVGWMPGLRSPEAAVELYRLAPERKPVFAK